MSINITYSSNTFVIYMYFLESGDCQLLARAVVAADAHQQHGEEAQRDRLSREGQLSPTFD